MRSVFICVRGTACAVLGVVVCVAPPVAARAAPADVGLPPGWSECSAPDGHAPDQPQDDVGRARLTVRDGTIALDVRDCSLTALLALISTHTAVRITVSEAVPPQRLTLRTSLQPIETAIRELLRDTDVFTLYAARAKGAHRLAAIWVYPRGGTRDIAPVPAELWASSTELERQLAQGDPELRARSVEELIARTGESALPRVLEATVDPDAGVRQRALDAALTAGLDVPVSHLQTLVLNDVSPEVRLRALQALEELPETRWIIEAAASDTDSDIRREAQSMLRRLQPPTR